MVADDHDSCYLMSTVCVKENFAFVGLERIESVGGSAKDVPGAVEEDAGS